MLCCAVSSDTLAGLVARIPLSHVRDTLLDTHMHEMVFNLVRLSAQVIRTHTEHSDLSGAASLADSMGLLSLSFMVGQWLLFDANEQVQLRFLALLQDTSAGYADMLSLIMRDLTSRTRERKNLVSERPGGKDPYGGSRE
jgi:hypothetical protein